MVKTNSINGYNNVQLRAQRPDYSNGQPAVAHQVMEGAQDTYVAQRAGKVEKTWITVPATVLAWLGICKGTDYFNNKLMSKEYEETPLGKLGVFGDKVTDGYRNSRFAQSNFGKWLHKARTNTKVFFRDRVVGNNKVLSSIRDNPTIPEWGMPYMESKGLLGKHSYDVKQLIEQFMAGPTTPEHLERVGYTPEQIKTIKQEIKTNGLKGEAKLNFLKSKEAEALGCTVTELPNARVKALGFQNKTAKDVENMLLKLEDHAKEVMNALGNSKKGICFVNEAGEGRLGFLRKIFFKRKVTTKELFNKYKLVLNEGAANPNSAVYYQKAVHGLWRVQQTGSQAVKWLH